jgi:signal transduction histidine kinase
MSHTKQNDNLEPLDLDDMISNIVDDYRSQIEKNNDVKLLYYNNNITDEPEKNNDSKIIVEADRARLIQVISNLLDNATKFTKKRDDNKAGSIYVTAEKKTNRENGSKKQEVIVIIKDTGIFSLDCLQSLLLNQKQVLDWDYSYARAL